MRSENEGEGEISEEEEFERVMRKNCLVMREEKIISGGQGEKVKDENI